MRTKFIVLTVSACLCVLNAYSQIPKPPMTALSPNAASLGLYGNVPVSLYTGTPEISIPLYDIRLGDFTLPVALSYHASGIRVDQRAGWTGVGWTLLAGGVITRSVNDMPDESNNGRYYLGENAGYYFNYKVLDPSTWNSRSYMRAVAQSIESIMKDTEPDEFSFSFVGYSGKFYLDHKRNWVVQCNRPVKVEFNNKFMEIPFDKTGTRAADYGYSPCFEGFTITTEDGTKYVFGGNIEAIDFSIGFFEQYIDEWIATAWHLTKIVLPTNEEIKFRYERNEFNNQMYIAVWHDLGSKTEGSDKLSPGCEDHVASSINASFQGKLLSPVYLKTISAGLTTVAFEKSLSNELNYKQRIYDDHYFQWYSSYSYYPFLPLLKSNWNGYPNCLNNLKWYKLDKITVKHIGGGETIKTIAFDYDNSPTRRLTLTKVTESGKNPYLFTYQNIENLPDYLANRSDHWGFYNGTYAYLNYGSYYGYRDPNAFYAKYGVLTKITYPTGGYTEFEFEPHYYGKQLQEQRWKTPLHSYSPARLAGGVRIKKIKSNGVYPGSSELVKEYFYVSDYLQNGANAQQSSGVLGGQIQYYFTDYTVYAFNDNNVKRRMSVFSSISVLPSCQNTQGNHIGYTEVIEKMPDNSFSRYRFTNFDNGYMDKGAEAVIQLSRTAYEPYNSQAMCRGLLISKEDYDASKRKLKSIDIQYEKNIVSGDDHVRAMKALYRNVCPSTAVSYDEGSSYKISTYLLRTKKETEAYYNVNNNGATQIRETSYEYNSRNMPSKTSQTQSKGGALTTQYIYVTDTPYPPTSIYKKLADRNIVGAPLVTFSMQNDQIISAERKTYEEVFPGIFKPTRIDRLLTPSNLSPSNLSPYQTIVRHKSGRLECNTNKENMEDYAYITVKSDSAVTFNMIINTDITGQGAYSYFSLSIKEEVSGARICGETYGIPLRNFRTGFSFLPSGSYVVEWKAPDYRGITGSCDYSFTEKVSVAQDSPDFRPEIGYKYNNRGNIIETVSEGNSVPTVYLRAYNYQYPIAEIRNATYSQVLQVINETTLNAIAARNEPTASDWTLINNLRNDTRFKEAMVTTYKYKPLVGMISSTDPAGISTYYDYDTFGRLKETYIMENGVKKTIQSYTYKYATQ